MALLNCRECGAEISSAAPACPRCGLPQNPAAFANVPGDKVSIEKEIQKQAITALVVAVAGFFCFAILFEPFAIYRSNKAMRLIRETGYGRQYSGIATTAFILSIILLIIGIVLTGTWALFMLGS